MFRRLFLCAVIPLALVQVGCAVNRATATVDPSANLAAIKSVHVVKEEGDDRDIDKLVVDKLKARGLNVTADPQPSAGADALVIYKDRWMWDITMYMLELTVIVRDPKSNFPLATGNSFHTSLTRKSPKEMVDEVIDNIFKEGK